VFGVKGTLISGAFGASFLCGGALGALAGARAVFIVAGAGVLLAWAWSAYGLRNEWREEPQPAEPEAAPAFGAPVSI
jgi:hypothetical protein